MKKILSNLNRQGRRKHFKGLKKILNMTWTEANSQLTHKVPYVNLEKRAKEGKG